MSIVYIRPVGDDGKVILVSYEKFKADDVLNELIVLHMYIGSENVNN